MTNIVKERPILFSGPMVSAILAGRKTQTRRIVKPQPEEGMVLCGPALYAPTKVDRHGEEYPGEDVFGTYSEDGEWGVKCPYGTPGDRLWVRETCLIWCDPEGQLVYSDDGPTYKDDPEYAGCLSDIKLQKKLQAEGHKVGCWKSVPSIHMPRWASRITLEITEIRVQQLQEISEEDAIAEGIERVGGEASCNPWKNYRLGKPGEMAMHCSCPTRSYMTLWESINGPGSWAANPWVWCVSFKKVQP